jgi:hypothetical protein
MAWYVVRIAKFAFSADIPRNTENDYFYWLDDGASCPMRDERFASMQDGRFTPMQDAGCRIKET